jgi:hypothetical protein
MPEPLLKCLKCGAVMVREDYHEYGWYLDGKEVACCSSAAKPVQVGRDDLKNLLAAIENVDPYLAQRHEYQRLLAALEGK